MSEHPLSRAPVDKKPSVSEHAMSPRVAEAPAPPARQKPNPGSWAYFAAVILATLGLGFDGLITIVVAILINLLAWRFAATTNSVLTKCCCPWLAPLTNTVRSAIWHSGYLLHKGSKNKGYQHELSSTQGLPSLPMASSSVMAQSDASKATSPRKSKAIPPHTYSMSHVDGSASEKDGRSRSLLSSKSASMFRSNHSSAALESLAAARELSGTVVQSFNGLMSMAWDGTGGGDLLGGSPRRSRSFSASFDLFEKGGSYDQDDDDSQDQLSRMDRNGSSSADSDLDEKLMRGGSRTDHSQTPPPGSFRGNVRKTSDDFGDLLMMDDDLERMPDSPEGTMTTFASFVPRSRKAVVASSNRVGTDGASGVASFGKPPAFHQRTQSDSVAASLQSSSWRTPLFDDGASPPEPIAIASAEDGSSSSPKRDESHRMMLRSRSGARNEGNGNGH